MLGVWTRGDVIKKLRETRKWTQGRLGQAAGVDKNTVNRIENDHPGTTLDSLAKVCAALGVTLEYVTSMAVGGVTSPVTPSTETVSQETSVADSLKARLLHLISSVDEAEAAHLYQLVRPWLAEVTIAPVPSNAPRNPPPKK